MGEMAVTEARRRRGPGKIIGASCYNQLKYAVEAERHGANYLLNVGGPAQHAIFTY